MEKNINKYSKSTQNKVGIISAFVVDVFYNHLYCTAVNYKTEGKTNSITEGYKHAIMGFLKGMNNQNNPVKGKKSDNFEKLILSLHEFSIKWEGDHSSYTLNKCIDKIVREFVPTDYVELLGIPEKCSILKDILLKSIVKFALFCSSDYLNNIIDNHNDETNIDVLKDKMAEILYVQRDLMYSKFLQSTISKNSETVDVGVAESLRNKLSIAMKKLYECNDENQKLKKHNDLMKTNMEKVLDSYKMNRNKNKGNEDELNNVKAKRNEIEKNYNKLKSDVATEREKYEQSDLIIRRLQNEIKVMESSGDQVKKLQAEINELRSKNNQLKTEIELLKNRSDSIPEKDTSGQTGSGGSSDSLSSSSLSISSRSGGQANPSTQKLKLDSFVKSNPVVRFQEAEIDKKKSEKPDDSKDSDSSDSSDSSDDTFKSVMLDRQTSKRNVKPVAKLVLKTTPVTKVAAKPVQTKPKIKLPTNIVSISSDDDDKIKKTYDDLNNNPSIEDLY